MITFNKAKQMNNKLINTEVYTEIKNSLLFSIVSLVFVLCIACECLLLLFSGALASIAYFNINL